MNSDVDGKAYKISTRFGSGTNDVITETIPIPEWKRMMINWKLSPICDNFTTWSRRLDWKIVLK